MKEFRTIVRGNLNGVTYDRTKIAGHKPNLLTIIELYLLTDQALLCPVSGNPYSDTTRLDMEFQASLITLQVFA